MKELRDRQKFKHILYSLPMLALAAALVIFLGRGAASIMLKERESAQTLETLQEKNAALAAREAELKEDVARLSTEEGVIEEIRAKFNVTQPGEHLAIVIAGEAEATTTEPSALKRGWAWFTSFLGL